MLYAIEVPAKFAAAFAVGEVGLMSTAAGATTTLVASGGSIVGTATLTEVGTGAATAAAAGISTTAIAVTAGAAVVVLAVIGIVVWRQHQKRLQALPTRIVVEGSEAEALAVMAEAQAIVDSAYADVRNRQLSLVELSNQDSEGK